MDFLNHNCKTIHSELLNPQMCRDNPQSHGYIVYTVYRYKVPNYSLTKNGC